MVLLSVPELVLGQDEGIIKSKNRAVVGHIVIDYDLASSGKSVFLVETKSGVKIWINTLQNLRGGFKAFVLNAIEREETVLMHGTIETNLKKKIWMA